MRNKLQVIQILRGVAASVVVLHHFSSAFRDYGKGTSYIVSSKIGELCSFGVDIFFIISGFIMFYTQFSDKSHTQGGFTVAAKFVKNRVKRIFPLYWFWTTVLLLLWLFSYALKSHDYSTKYIICSYLLIPMESKPEYFHPLLDQGWTLSFEVYFYLIFGLTLIFKKHITNIFWMTLMFGLLYVIGSMDLLGVEGKYLFTSTLVLEFLFGGVLAIIYMRYESVFINKYWYLALLIVGLLLLGISIYIEADRVIELGLPSLLILYSCLMIDKAFGISWRKDNFFSIWASLHIQFI
jgi:peptidoglycan/LPS O-acetylase OafA/YrhL